MSTKMFTGNEVIMDRDRGDMISVGELVSCGGGGGEDGVEEVGEVGEGGAGVAVRGASTSVELGRQLLAAARDGDTALVLDLMARGAPFTSDWLGTSPLHLAAGNNQADMCAVLLRAGVSRDARTKVERTPLHLAAYFGHEETVRVLLEHGAMLDCRDMLGMTPLAWAVERGHVAAARALLAAGADPAHRSKFRTSPRDLAAQAGHTELLAHMDAALAHREQLEKNPQEKSPVQPEFITIQDQSNTEETEKTTNEETDTNGGGGGGGGRSAAARLLRRHGITLLPPDTGSTLLAALSSGRTIHLSDAGKLMLKESVAEAKASMAQASPAAARSPAKLVAINKKTTNTSNITIKKIVSTNDQVRYVALPNNTRILPKPIQVKPQPQPQPLQPATEPLSLAADGGGGVVRVPELYLQSNDPEYLRSQLLHAVAALTKARNELNKLKKKTAGA